MNFEWLTEIPMNMVMTIAIVYVRGALKNLFTQSSWNNIGRHSLLLNCRLWKVGHTTEYQLIYCTERSRQWETSWIANLLQDSLPVYKSTRVVSALECRLCEINLLPSHLTKSLFWILIYHTRNVWCHFSSDRCFVMTGRTRFKLLPCHNVIASHRVDQLNKCIEPEREYIQKQLNLSFSSCVVSYSARWIFECPL